MCLAVGAGHMDQTRRWWAIPEYHKLHLINKTCLKLEEGSTVPLRYCCAPHQKRQVPSPQRFFWWKDGGVWTHVCAGTLANNREVKAHYPVWVVNNWIPEPIAAEWLLIQWLRDGSHFSAWPNRCFAFFPLILIEGPWCFKPEDLQ